MGKWIKTRTKQTMIIRIICASFRKWTSLCVKYQTILNNIYKISSWLTNLFEFKKKRNKRENECMFVNRITFRGNQLNTVVCFVSIAWSISLHRLLWPVKERERKCMLGTLFAFNIQKKLCNLIKRWRDLTLQTEFWISKSPARFYRTV